MGIWIRMMTLLSVFALLPGGWALAAQPGVACYLVDARVHLAVVTWEAGSTGELCWHDTVTGRRGEARFVREEGRLVVRSGEGPASEVHVLPDLAVVVRNPPWTGGARVALGVALD